MASKIDFALCILRDLMEDISERVDKMEGKASEAAVLAKRAASRSEVRDTMEAMDERVAIDARQTVDARMAKQVLLQVLSCG